MWLLRLVSNVGSEKEVTVGMEKCCVISLLIVVIRLWENATQMLLEAPEWSKVTSRNFAAGLSMMEKPTGIVGVPMALNSMPCLHSPWECINIGVETG